MRTRFLVLFVALGTAIAVLFVSGGAQASTTGTGSRFVPLTSFRLADTTSGTGGSSSPLGAGVSRDYQVAGVGGIPTTNVTAVVIDLAATRMTGATVSSLRAYASGGVRSDENSIVRVDPNHLPDSNTAIIPVGGNGKISVYNAAGSVDFNADVQGYFTKDSTSGGGYTPVLPTRMVDTVAGVGIRTGVITSATPYDVQISGSLVPAGASAIFANVKVFGSSANGGLRVGPGGETATAPISVDYQTGTYTDSGMAIKLSSDGKIRLRNLTAASGINVIVDVQGYFMGGGASGSGGTFTALSQQNIYDSATDVQNLQPNEKRRVVVTGAGGVPIDPSVGAVSMTISASAWSTNGFVNVYNADVWDLQGAPATSMLSFNSAVDPSNGVTTTAVVDLSSQGEVIIQNYSSAPVRVRLSAQGWFSSSTPTPSATDPEADDPETTGGTQVGSDVTPVVDPAHPNDPATATTTGTMPSCQVTGTYDCRLTNDVTEDPAAADSGAAMQKAVREGVSSGALPKSAAASSGFCVPTGCYTFIYHKNWSDNIWAGPSHANHHGRFYYTPDGKYVWETASHAGIVGFHSCHVISTFAVDMKTDSCTAPRYGSLIHSHYWLNVKWTKLNSWELCLGSAVHHGNGTSTYSTKCYS